MESARGGRDLTSRESVFAPSATGAVKRNSFAKALKVKQARPSFIQEGQEQKSRFHMFRTIGLKN